MSPHAGRVRELLALRPAACTDTRVMVGGAPFNADPQLWQAVAPDAMKVIAEAKRLFSRKAKRGVLV